MTKDQAIHVSMINSMNVITGKHSVSDIVAAGVAIFSHYPDETIDSDSLNDIILYFESKQMFEHCAVLLKYYRDNFDEDGMPTYKTCDCPYPTIETYTTPLMCSTCSNRIEK
jgi:hypothetical protein